MASDESEGGKPQKTGFFGRLFGRGEAKAPAPAPELQTAPEPEPRTAPEPEPAAVIEAEATVSPASAPVEPPPAAPIERVEAPASPPESAAVPAPVKEAPVEAAAKASWWERLRSGLSRSSSAIGQGITEIFTKRKLDAAMLDELEDILIQADLGVTMATRIRDAVGKGRFEKDIEPGEVKQVLAREVEAVLAPVAHPIAIDAGKKPFVILVVGVNGSGKTTTIGKLATNFVRDGKKVVLAAGDTFRAAAIEQLQIWGARVGAPVVARPQGADAAGLAFDAMKDAQEQGAEIVLMDTAGRLQNRAELMAELEKIVRVMKKVDESAPHAVLLVLDATVGQNALSQVEIFGRTAGVTGLVMTKLDGTARGGILVAIAEKFKLPVHYIGVGEGAEDLEPFTARDFARAIAGLEA